MESVEASILLITTRVIGIKWATMRDANNSASISISEIVISFKGLNLVGYTKSLLSKLEDIKLICETSSNMNRAESEYPISTSIVYGDIKIEELRDCNLTQVGGLLDSKGYGIGTPKGSLWRDHLSLAILELQEKGTIQMLYNKWWKNTGDNIGGVFVVLLCGLTIAIIVAILEFCWNSRKNALSDRQSLCSEMTEELRFAIRCYGSRQKPALRRSCSQCSPDDTYVPVIEDFSNTSQSENKISNSAILYGLESFSLNDQCHHFQYHINKKHLTTK
ncbi:GRIN [Lepeophtheirus salmonis]|uniref:GRIN n=1 Tax=Lepeophtheirus salmonis TaxID=72036 RepID=A0A7R8CH97_LEPSM|nr:GRIN [Lepeophtheirus salmonis]CAF2818242.1 GRIN [Lepeophtheirus salmonis]